VDWLDVKKNFAEKAVILKKHFNNKITINIWTNKGIPV
jgi:hypothetical protein